MYKIDYITLNDEFNSRRGKIVNGMPPKKGIPFIDSNTTVAGIDSTYYPVAQSVEYALLSVATAASVLALIDYGAKAVRLTTP
jgi:hypothetical protein